MLLPQKGLVPLSVNQFEADSAGPAFTAVVE